MKSYPDFPLFCKTDEKSFHDSVDHYTLMMNLHAHTNDGAIMAYVWQFLNWRSTLTKLM